MWIRLSTLILGLVFSLNSFGQVEVARKVTEILCSDSLYGRGYVNDGVNKAASFVENEFKKAGLKPFFRENSFTQDYSFRVNTFPGKMLVKSGEHTYRPGVDYIISEYSGSYTGELLIQVIDSATTFGEPNAEINRKVTSGEINTFLFDLTEYSQERQGELKQIMMQLAKFVNVIALTDQKFIWSVAQGQLRYPIIYFQKDIFLKNESVFIDIEAEIIPEFKNKNIIGYIPSKKKNPDKAKTIIFSAHYDHLGMMGTIPEQTIFPGGNDNASGTSMLISLANHYVKSPSKYNIIFIAFSGEEIGLLGSKHFVESGSMAMSDIHFLVNLDILGSGEEGITVVNGKIHKKEFKKLQKINKRKKYLTTVNSRGEAANSDHWYFHQAGVPSIFIYTMGPNKHYHDVYDTYEELSFAAYNSIFNLLIDFVKKL